MIMVRTATQRDNAQLAELTKLTPMKGRISICIRRYPDFFSILYKRGEPHVFVAVENETVIGCVSIVKEEMVLQDKLIPSYYLCDLKVHPDHRNKKIATIMCEQMHNYLLEKDADILVSIVADGNYKVMPIMYGKGGIGGGRSLGKITVYQFLPKNKFSAGEYTIESTNDELILKMYQKFYTRYVLHPPIRPEYIKDCKNFIAVKDGEPVAAVSLYDPILLKQNVIISAPWYLMVALWTLKTIIPRRKISYLPRIGEPINILYVKGFSVAEGQEKALISLINFSREIAFNKGYTFLSLSLHENDRLKKYITKIRSFSFNSIPMIGSLKTNSTLLDTLKDGNIYEDFSIV